MLPPLKECQQQIEKHNYSSFDKFWKYKLYVERDSGSIIDENHIEETVDRLVKHLLLRDEWQLWWTGIASLEKIADIFRNNRQKYDRIKSVKLGDGKIDNKPILEALNSFYAGMKGLEFGITHNQYDKDSPKNGDYFVLGRSKILMFIWGQTPGFDIWLRRGLYNSGIGISCPWICENRWTPSQFCKTITVLDNWVKEWEKRERLSFINSLSKFNRPTGRLIDMIYWRQS